MIVRCRYEIISPNRGVATICLPDNPDKVTVGTHGVDPTEFECPRDDLRILEDSENLTAAYLFGEGVIGLATGDYGVPSLVRHDTEGYQQFDVDLDELVWTALQE